MTALAAMSRAYRGWGGSAPVTHVLHDGGELAFAGRTFEVLHRPGHSPSDTVFWDAEAAVLLAGDHLIKHISSNPLISQPLGGRSGEPSQRAPARADHVHASRCELTQAMPIETVLPGHGDRVRRPRRADRRALRDARAARPQVRRADRRAPRTAHDIAQATWGNVAVTQAYLTLSEVLGHIDLLLERGEVVEDERDGVVHFTTA